MLPGIILGVDFLPTCFKKNGLTTVFGVMTISFSSSIIISFVLIALSIFNRFSVLCIYIVMAFIFLLMMIRKITGTTIMKPRFSYTLKKPDLWTSLPIITSIIFSLSYLLYQNQGFPRGHDGSMHYVRLMQLISSGDIGLSEIGTPIAPYYPRGYHFSLGVFTHISGVNPTLSLVAFNTLIFSLLSIVIFSFSYTVIKEKKAASLSSICFLLVARVFLIQGSYPMVFSLYFFAAILVLIDRILKNEPMHKLEWVYFWLVLVGVISTHIISTEITLLFIFSIVLFFCITEIDIRELRIKLKVFMGAVFIGILAVLFLVLVNPMFMIGQLEFAIIHSTAPAAPVDLINELTYRSALSEFAILFVSFAIAPFFVIGFIHAVQEKMKSMIAISAIAAILVLAQIISLNGREPYILFFPMLALAGLGMMGLMNNLSKSKMGKLLVINFILVTLVFSSINLVYISQNPMIGGYVPLSDADLAYCNFLNENKVNGEIIASINNPTALLIQSITNNSILCGDSRYYDIESFQDIALIFSENRSINIVNDVVEKWKITAVFLKTGWGNNTGIFSDLQLWYPTSTIIEFNDYHLLLLGEFEN